MSTNYAPGQPDDDNPRPDGAEVVAFPARTLAAAPPAEPAALSDTSYEIALDDDPDADPGAVDDGIGFVLDDDPDAYPVIPEHLRSLAGVGGTLARHGRRLGHRTAFHGVRSPLYLILALWWAVVGVFRLAGRQVSWWWVAETDLLRSAAVANQDAREWMRLHREAKETRLIRGIVLAA